MEPLSHHSHENWMVAEVTEIGINIKIKDTFRGRFLNIQNKDVGLGETFSNIYI